MLGRQQVIVAEEAALGLAGFLLLYFAQSWAARGGNAQDRAGVSVGNGAGPAVKIRSFVGAGAVGVRVGIDVVLVVAVGVGDNAGRVVGCRGRSCGTVLGLDFGRSKFGDVAGDDFLCQWRGIGEGSSKRRGETGN